MKKSKEYLCGNRYKQRGVNPFYPEVVDIWQRGLPVPEWLSDLAKIKFLDGDGNITLETRDLGDGGYEILGSDGITALCRTKGRGDYICLGDGHILLTLTPKQFKILYHDKKS